jgi:uncharacterized membrane protein
MKPEDQLRNQSLQSVGPAPDVVRDKDKIMLVLAYFGILALIPLLTVKDSSFVQWHAKNGIVWMVASFLLLTISGVISFGIISCLLVPAVIAVSVVAIVKALKGERWRIPLVSDLAEKL